MSSVQCIKACCGQSLEVDGNHRGKKSGKSPANVSDIHVKISKLAMYVCLSALIVDPGGGAGIKLPAMAIVLFAALYSICTIDLRRTWWVEGAFLILIIGRAVVSIIVGTPANLVIDSISFLSFFVLLPALRGIAPSDIDIAFCRIGYIMAWYVILVFSYLLLNPNSAAAINQWSEIWRLGYLGLKPGSTTIPNVYFSWSVWLLLAFALAITRKAYFLATISAGAIMLTLSSALIGALVLLIAIEMLRVRGLRSKLIIYSSTILIAMAFLLLSLKTNNLLDFVLDKFTFNSPSTIVKLGHIHSIINIVTQRVDRLLVGMGPGTSFYSSGIDGYTINTEVSYFNILRQYGIFGVIVVFSYILFVMRGLYYCACGKQWMIALGVMLLVTGTNPLLLSPIFFVPLILGRTYAIESKRRSNRRR